MIFVVNEANAVNSLVMRSTISRSMVVPLDNTRHRRCKLRVPCCSGKRCRGSAGFFADETWLEQIFSATEMFGVTVMMFPSGSS